MCKGFVLKVVLAEFIEIQEPKESRRGVYICH